MPADEESAKAATAAMIEYKGPVYLRVGRPDVPKIYTDGPVAFQIGKANQLRDGKDLTIVANGLMVAPALDAAETLAGEGIQARVLDMHTVKPVDRDALRPPRRRPAPWSSPRSTWRTAGWAAWWPYRRRAPAGADPVCQPPRPVRRERCPGRADREIRPHRRERSQSGS